MRFTSQLTFALLVAGSLSILGGCHSDNSTLPTKKTQQPGTSVQNGTGVADPTVKKCDDQRMDLRRTTFEFLGIDVLQASSDKVMKQISPDDLKKIVADAIEYSASDTTQSKQDDDFSEISDILEKATKMADIYSATPTIIPGTNPIRLLHIGAPDYIDGAGNFSLGSAYLQKAKGNKVGDILGVILGVGLNTDPSKSFQAYSIGLQQITNAADAENSIIHLSDYIEKQLPTFCHGVKSNLDLQTFNTIAVGAS
jgi:uncharacterized protein YozE (UPF0346 family)